MAAVTTKKATGDVGVQLTFPQNFIKAYEGLHVKPRFAGGELTPQPQTYVGDDFYAINQRQKREEANKMVMARVQASKSAEQRYLTGPNGYGPMRPVELSQRKIGSNFGVGVGSMMGYGTLGLSGGVLGSREGSNWAKEALARRVAQLDAINQSKIAGPTIQSQVDSRMDFADQSKLEIMTIFDALEANVMSAESKIDAVAFENARRLLTLIFRYATSEDSQKNLGRDLEQYLGKTDSLLGLLEGFISERARDDELEETSDLPMAAAAAAPSRKALAERVEKGAKVKQTRHKYIINLINLLDKLMDYLEVMYKNVERPANERKALSQSLFKSLKFNVFGESGANIKKTSIKELPPFERPAAEDAISGVGFTRKPVSAEVSSGPSVILPRSALAEDDRARIDSGRMAGPREKGTRDWADSAESARFTGLEGFDVSLYEEGGGGEELRAAPARGTGPREGELSPENIAYDRTVLTILASPEMREKLDEEPSPALLMKKVEAIYNAERRAAGLPSLAAGGEEVTALIADAAARAEYYTVEKALELLGSSLLKTAAKPSGMEKAKASVLEEEEAPAAAAAPESGFNAIQQGLIDYLVDLGIDTEEYVDEENAKIDSFGIYKDQIASIPNENLEAFQSVYEDLRDMNGLKKKTAKQLAKITAPTLKKEISKYLLALATGRKSSE